MATGAPDRRNAKPNGSTPQPGPSNIPHQPPYGYVPQYMSPHPVQPMHPVPQMYQPHIAYAPYGYQQHPYPHPPQGYYPQIQYVHHMPTPHPHYPSGIPSPYQHNPPPWPSPAPQMPPSDPGMSTPPIYAPQPYAPPMHAQPIYQSPQPHYLQRNVPHSPSSHLQPLGSPGPRGPPARSPSLPHARLESQSRPGGSATGSPSARHINYLAPLPAVTLEQQGEPPIVVQTPVAEHAPLVPEPIPNNIGVTEPPINNIVTVEPAPNNLPSPPPRSPPQPPPPPIEEVLQTEEVQDDTLRFAGGRIPTPNAESTLVFAVPSVTSSSPPPSTVQHEVSVELPASSVEQNATPLPPQTFTSAPIYSNTSQDGLSLSPKTSASQVKDVPKSLFSIAGRRPDVSNAPGLSFSRRAKIPAHVAADAVPLPKPAPAPAPTAAPTTQSAELEPAPATAAKSPSKSQKSLHTAAAGTKNAQAQKPEAPVSAPTPDTNATPAPSSAPADSAASETTTAPSSVAPQPAPPVKQPPKSWAALLRPATPVKPVKAPQPQGSTTAPAASASGHTGHEPGTQPKVNGHTGANGTVEPLPTNIPLHVVLADGVQPYSALSQVTQPRGLINSGNMCFANVVLQALVYSAPFVRLFETLARLVPGNLDGKTTLYEATILFLREFAPERDPPSPAPAPRSKARSGTSTPMPPEQTRQQAWNENPFIPEHLYEAMRQNKRFDSMQRGHQEDAEEFLGFFLDTLHEELLTILSRVQANPTPAGAAWTNGSADKSAQGDNAREVQRPVSPGAEDENGWLEVGKKNKATVTRTTRATESAITKIFGGKIRSVLHTPGASKDSVTLEPYQPLQLDIQSDNVRTIEDALKHITQPETVSVYSEQRGGLVDARKQITLDTLPPLLILHLKRLVYDAKGIQKNSKVIEYSTSLEIKPDIISPTRRSNKSIKYNLYGVVYHHGKHATGGHYTIDVLRQDLSEWVRIDDTHIEPVTEKDVTAHEKHAKLDKTAYLLFYRREPDHSK
ncbi:ubiquitin carboxyl-terminal hydrolase [Ceratobasidium sp. AG-Ba]|nr:ubiquitin carboxyl-terminal hydrolase [Ceratobasidium sp. AG-Ba]QRW03833.1 ubiquitin carboxyl-terminal hydrolase [Ceratobasidium sp. AG-Ba]